MTIKFKDLSTIGKVNVILSILTYYPCALCLWMQIPNDWTHKNFITRKTSTKRTILMDILAMNFRRSWLRSLLSDLN